MKVLEQKFRVVRASSYRPDLQLMIPVIRLVFNSSISSRTKLMGDPPQVAIGRIFRPDQFVLRVTCTRYTFGRF